MKERIAWIAFGAVVAVATGMATVVVGIARALADIEDSHFELFPLDRGIEAEKKK